MEMPALVPSGVRVNGVPADRGGFDRVVRAALRPFGVETERGDLIALAAGLVFCLRLGDLVVANLAEALFVKRIGPSSLPRQSAAADDHRADGAQIATGEPTAR